MFELGEICRRFPPDYDADLSVPILDRDAKIKADGLLDCVQSAMYMCRPNNYYYVVLYSIQT